MLTTLRKWGNSSGIIIPKKILESMNLSPGDEMSLSIDDEKLIIKKNQKTSEDDMSYYILKDLMEQGYEGEDLLNKFKYTKKQFPNAVERMVQEAVKEYEEGETISLEEFFND
ncbi:MAG: AbrB/MazE/SpoVT family DNA-binding domain-containing protein [Tissierellia bacterium]|nr:AbrB/MazE/SpoVT family DNA-binding domain-containing protein [Tissierellia bacterium]